MLKNERDRENFSQTLSMEFDECVLDSIDEFG